MTPEEIFNKAWDILVEHAGASKDPDNRANFVQAYTTWGKNESYSATEWRFGGYLGFGGKFWRTAGRYYISCYSEDKKAKQTKIIEKVNSLLSGLPYFQPKRD